MKDFKELVTLLGKNHLPLDDTKLGLRARELYLYVRRVAEPTDQGAARKLKLEKGSGAYRKVKHKLKYALLDGITAVKRKPGVVRDRPAAALACWGTIALARSTPQAYGLIPRELIDHQLQQTQDYDLLEAASQLTDILADRPSVGPDVVHYLDRSDYLGALGYATASVMGDSFHISFLRNQNEDGERIAEFAAKSFLKAKRLSKGLDYEKLYFNTSLLELHQYLAVSDYLKVVAVCNSILTEFSSKEYTGKENTLNMVKINLLNAYTQLGRFEKGKEIAEKLLYAIPKEKLNYTKVIESLILLCLRTGNYQLAYNYYHEYDIENIKNNLPEYFSETLDIFKAYIYLAIDLKMIAKKKADLVFTNFRLQRFVNNFQHAQKEKSSRNIHLVLIKLIRGIINNNILDPIDNVYAVEKYARRHLNETTRKRSFLFISALSYIVKQGRSENSIMFAQQKYIKRISELPIQGAHHHSNLEIVRYDILFDTIAKCIVV